ncbi:MAG: hypothetical protein DRG30_04595 [Epsilonproteobacteria bacterium]|nr:MAG: hypothetical protein DRG30_04595 [Campylobacterota bacterium]
MELLGQIGKRLQIIKIAISLTDDETINIQRSQLKLHKDDAQLDTILSMLNGENYAQASNLIDQYLRVSTADHLTSTPETTTDQPSDDINGCNDEMDQKISSRSREEAELIKKFGLFMEGVAKEEAYNPISEDEMYLMSKEAADKTVPSEEEISTLPPKQPNAKDIIDQFYAIDKENLPHRDTMEDASLKHTQVKDEVAEIAQVGDQPTEEEDSSYTIPDTIEDELDDREESDDGKELDDGKEEISDEPSELLDDRVYEEVNESETGPQETDELLDEEPIEYTPISYIDQKLKNMLNQYPQVEESSEHFKSEEDLLATISLKGYTEADIQAEINKVFLLQKEGKLAEASHLLLICAATESLYAQFFLARELYKGKILQRDLSEAFTQINRMAINGYPEAICDLAQLYENGIGIDKDKKKAFDLYQDALESGVERADAHITRMEDASTGILGKIFRF